jgi:hypothetical protein
MQLHEVRLALAPVQVLGAGGVGAPVRVLGCLPVQLVGAEQLLEASDRDSVPLQVGEEAAGGPVEWVRTQAAAAVVRAPASADRQLLQLRRALRQLLVDQCSDAHAAASLPM